MTTSWTLTVIDRTHFILTTTKDVNASTARRAREAFDAWLASPAGTLVVSGCQVIVDQASQVELVVRESADGRDPVVELASPAEIRHERLTAAGPHSHVYPWSQVKAEKMGWEPATCTICGEPARRPKTPEED